MANFEITNGVLVRCIDAEGEVISPDGVTEIGDGAFENCEKLTSVRIPEGVRIIRKNAFRSCSHLAEVSFPEGLAQIGKFAFEYCRELKKPVIPHTVKRLGDGAFKGCTELVGIRLPEGITEISKSLFEGCTRLREIVIPPNVSRIGISSFTHCMSLSRVEIPHGVERVSFMAFGHCSSLEEIVFPDSVRYIGDLSFFSCRSLKRVILPEYVESVGLTPFADCSVEEINTVWSDDRDIDFDALGIYDTDAIKCWYTDSARIYGLRNGNLVRAAVCGFLRRKNNGLITPDEERQWHDLMLIRLMEIVSLLPDEIYPYSLGMERERFSREDVEKCLELTGSIECRAALLQYRRDRFGEAES